MQEFVCIGCPKGCQITVDDKGNISGYSCPKGLQYAINELTHPMRILTSSIRVSNRENTLVSVKTSREIPKEKLLDMMNFINKLSVEAPTNIGDVVYHNPLGLEVDILITKKMD